MKPPGATQVHKIGLKDFTFPSELALDFKLSTSSANFLATDFK